MCLIWLMIKIRNKLATYKLKTAGIYWLILKTKPEPEAREFVFVVYGSPSWTHSEPLIGGLLKKN